MPNARDPSRSRTDTDETAEEIQQIWLSNKLIECVKEVAHDIDERVQHVLKNGEPPAH